MALVPYPDTSSTTLEDEPGQRALITARDDDVYFAKLRGAATDAETRFEELASMVYENASAGRLSKVLLGEQGAPSLVNAQQSGSGQTLLHLAAFWGRPAIAQLLVELGADVEVRNAEARTALELAVDWKRPKVANIIRAAGGFSPLEEKIAVLEAQNAGLVRAVDQSRRSLERAKTEIAVQAEELRDARADLAASEERERVAQRRAEGAERVAAREIAKQGSEKMRADKLQTTVDELTESNQKLRIHLMDVAGRLKVSLTKELKGVQLRTRLARKLARARKRKKQQNSSRALALALAKEKFKAVSLKLILLSKELRRRDIEVVRLSKVEQQAKQMQRALEKRRAMTLMEALRALVPVDVLTQAFRTLQHLAVAGQRMRRESAKKKNNKTKTKRPHTALPKLSKRGKEEREEEEEEVETGCPKTAQSVSDKVLADLETAKTELGVEWSEPVPDVQRCKLLGGVRLPFPLMAVTPKGVSCIIVSRSTYDHETHEETLVVQDGAPIEELSREEIGPVQDEKSLLERMDWIDGGGKWRDLANSEVVGETAVPTKHRRRAGEAGLEDCDRMDLPHYPATDTTIGRVGSLPALSTLY